MQEARRTVTVWDVREGEALAFAGTGVRVAVVRKSGRAARLRIDAPADVRIEKSADPGVATPPSFVAGMAT